jgi:hypothetical protein
MWNDFWNWLATLPQGSASFVGTLAGSTLGLIALLLGALFNAHLNRKRDDRLREQDRQGLAAALHSELSSIEHTLLENAKRLTEKPPDEGSGFLVPDVMHSSLLFKDMLPKIGLFDPATTRKLIDSYILLSQYFEGLILVGGVVVQKLPEGRRLAQLPTAMASFVIEYNQARAGFIKEAINALAPSISKNG